MIVHVLFFARARELAGTASLDLEMPAGSTVGDVRRVLANQLPSIKPILARSLLAINQEYAGDDQVTADGDEIACIPPVSGG